MPLGLTTTTTHKIQPISKVAHLIPPIGSLDKTDPILVKNGDTYKTVELMQDIVRKYGHETKALARSLRGKTLEQTLRNIFDFVFTHVKYEKDNPKIEQLRRPLRTLHDQKGDCDCMSLLIGSLLHNLDIPFNFRITKYDGKSNFQHVYVVVKTSQGEIIIDPVIGEYNTEKQYSEKKDFAMNGLDGIPIQFLNGIDGKSDMDIVEITRVAMATDLNGIEGLGAVEADEAMYKYLVRTRNVIASNPELVQNIQNPAQMLQMYDFAIKYWNTPRRQDALDQLAREEKKLIAEGAILMGIEAYDDDELEEDEWEDVSGFDGFNAIEEEGYDYRYIDAETGELLGDDDFEEVEMIGELNGRKKRKARKAARQQRKTTRRKTRQDNRITRVAKKNPSRADKLTNRFQKRNEKIAEEGAFFTRVAKKSFQTVKRFNPVSLAAKGGVLAWIRTNIGKSGDKLALAYTPEFIIKRAEIYHPNEKVFTRNNWIEAKTALAKTEKLFVKTLGGKKSNLKKVILAGGRDKKYMVDAKEKPGQTTPRTPDGDYIDQPVSGLGVDPVTATAGAAAAAPFIVKIAGFLKKINIDKAADKILENSAERQTKKADKEPGFIKRLFNKNKDEIKDSASTYVKDASKNFMPNTSTDNSTSNTSYNPPAPAEDDTGKGKIYVNVLKPAIGLVKKHPIGTALVATGITVVAVPKIRNGILQMVGVKKPSATPKKRPVANKRVPAKSLSGVKKVRKVTLT